MILRPSARRPFLVSSSRRHSNGPAARGSPPPCIMRATSIFIMIIIVIFVTHLHLPTPHTPYAVRHAPHMLRPASSLSIGSLEGADGGHAWRGAARDAPAAVALDHGPRGDEGPLHHGRKRHGRPADDRSRVSAVVRCAPPSARHFGFCLLLRRLFSRRRSRARVVLLNDPKRPGLLLGPIPVMMMMMMNWT